MALYDFIFGRRQWRTRILNYASLAVPFAAFLYLRSRVDTSMIITFAVNPIASAGFFTCRIVLADVEPDFPDRREHGRTIYVPAVRCTLRICRDGV